MPYTSAEYKIIGLLTSLPDQVLTRDQVAQCLWGPNWIDKYSESVIDTLMCRIRKKLEPGKSLKTIRNRGFVYHEERNLPYISDDPISLISPPLQVLPTQNYLEYMNNPQNNRKTLVNLFSLKEPSLLTLPTDPTILIIDSCSYDNVDAVLNWLKALNIHNPKIFFTGYDERALKLHRNRVQDLKVQNVQVIYDDIRTSNFKIDTFDLIINDFRLNFNVSHQQNRQAISHMFRILKPNGKVLVSVVIDARYESPRYGSNQQKAPLNIHSPWKFMADEKLERSCFTVPYYKRVFSEAGFELISEFDLDNGKTWAKTLKSYSPTTAPFYRRFLLQKPALV